MDEPETVTDACLFLLAKASPTNASSASLLPAQHPAASSASVRSSLAQLRQTAHLNHCEWKTSVLILKSITMTQSLGVESIILNASSNPCRK